MYIFHLKYSQLAHNSSFTKPWIGQLNCMSYSFISISSAWQWDSLCWGLEAWTHGTKTVCNLEISKQNVSTLSNTMGVFSSPWNTKYKNNKYFEMIKYKWQIFLWCLVQSKMAKFLGSKIHEATLFVFFWPLEIKIQNTKW